MLPDEGDWPVCSASRSLLLLARQEQQTVMGTRKTWHRAGIGRLARPEEPPSAFEHLIVAAA
jgi:hypothetical protein